MNEAPSAPRRPRLATPLVVVTTVVVTVLAMIMLAREPDRLWAWIAAGLFLPLALGVLQYLRSRPEHRRSPNWVGKTRAALVGAGVLLATALAFELTDSLGITGEDGELAGRPLLMFLPAAVAVIAEIVGMRLEHKAEKDPDDEGQ